MIEYGSAGTQKSAGKTAQGPVSGKPLVLPGWPLQGDSAQESQFVSAGEFLWAPPTTAALLAQFLSLLHRFTAQQEFVIEGFTPAEEEPVLDGRLCPFGVRQLQFRADEAWLLADYCADLDRQLREAPSPARHTNLFSQGEIAVFICRGRLSVSQRTGLQQSFEDHCGALLLLVEQGEAHPRVSWLQRSVPCGKGLGERLDHHLRVLADGLSRKPREPILQQEILDSLDIQAMLRAQAGPAAAFDEMPVYRSIERNALIHANKTAVVYLKSSLTYAELDQQANQLAQELLAHGIGVGDTVVACLQPGLALPVALLAVHKAGGVYVPLDPGFPHARIRDIFELVKPVLVLCNGAEVTLPADFQGQTLHLDQFITHGHGDAKAIEIPQATFGAEAVSHIFFTSGTTGKPKGVVSTHANLVHYVRSAIAQYRFDSTDRFIAAARFTFSISMFELLTPLVVGASVNILPRAQVLDMPALTRAVQASTVFHFGPSLLKQLLPHIQAQHQDFTAFNGLKHVSSGGDTVAPELLEALKRIFQRAEVYVIYGSSEISCMGCTWQVPRDAEVRRTRVGRAFQNTGFCVLDSFGRLVPAGVAGQVHFYGAGLAQGYLGSPELTHNSFRQLYGQRCYAMGDVGRVDPEGNLELLGREDFQVQIRGMRVELLEIEQCLKRLPAVADCVVVARSLTDDAPPSLVAYLVAQANAVLSAQALARHLRGLLPDYMIPSVFVHLGALPVNHNAKLDRNQLPAPAVDNLLISEDFQYPADDIEAQLIEILENLFAIRGIGARHNFFELGGDSLSAVRFLIEVDKRYDKFIPITYLLTHPTVSDIAEVVRSNDPLAAGGNVVVLKKGNTEAPLFCLYGVLLYRDLAAQLKTPRMVCGVYLQQEILLMKDGVESEELRLSLTVGNIAESYIEALTAFQPNGPYYLCGESFGGIIAMEVARQLRQRGQSVELVAMFDSLAPGFMEAMTRAEKLRAHLQIAVREGLPYLRQKLQLLAGRLKRVGDLRASRAGQTQSDDVRVSARVIATANYWPEPYPGPVVLFRARQRPAFEPSIYDLGWSRFIQNLQVVEVSGDHLGMLKEGHVHDLAYHLGRYLDA